MVGMLRLRESLAALTSRYAQHDKALGALRIGGIPSFVPAAWGASAAPRVRSSERSCVPL